MKKELVGKALIEARTLYGLSRDRLAVLVGCSTKSIERWERGETTPIPALRKALERVLGGGQ